jgi:hypothetical protein
MSSMKTIKGITIRNTAALPQHSGPSRQVENFQQEIRAACNSEDKKLNFKKWVLGLGLVVGCEGQDWFMVLVW